MPIQFRCQFCRQLLGISRSRAGSLVDCPACGRSLRVPAEDGTPAKPDTTTRQQADARLRSALEELSGLGGFAGVAEPAPVTTPQPRSPKLATAPAPQKKTSGTADRMRIVPLKTGSSASTDALEELADIPESEDDEQLPEIAEPEILDDPEESAAAQPVKESQEGSFRSALRELDSLAVPTMPISPIPEQRSSWLVTTCLVLATGLGSCAVGYYLGRRTNPGTTESSVTPQQDPEKGTEKTPEAKAAPKENPVAGELRGTVQFQNDAGQFLPDDEALIVLVPAQNVSGLRLDAKPLRDPPDSVSRRAVEAALKVLNVTIVRTGADGTFAVPHNGTSQVIVISRHTARAAGQETAPDVQTALAAWFDSPAQLVGRLEARLIAINGAETNPAPLDVRFEKK